MSQPDRQIYNFIWWR